jgi:outer membrane receptor protein involved in Fe transport
MQLHVQFHKSGIDAFFASPYVILRHLTGIASHGPGWSVLPVYNPYGNSAAANELKKRIGASGDIREAVALDIGLQHHFVKISGTSVEDRNFNAAGQQILTTSSRLNSDSKMLLPSIGVVFDATDLIQLFTGYSRNFAAIGDWAIEKTDTDFANLRPEVATNYEIGARFQGRGLRSRSTASSTTTRSSS